MKKKYLLSIAAITVITFGNIQAQVVNGGFETVKPNLLASNWGMNFLFPVTINTETGESVSDEIFYGSCMPAFVFSTSDAHTGNYALQLTNGMNGTTNQVIAAKATIFADPESDMPGWNPGIPLSPTDEVTMLGFYYKFFPMGNDVAQVELVVFDENSNEIGRATADIAAPSAEYSYLYAPVQFTSSATPAFMIITFSMLKEGSVPNYGSSLLIDDVVVNSSALKTINFQSNSFTIYPTIADQEITIVNGAKAKNGNSDFKIFNTNGKLVQEASFNWNTNASGKIDVSQLPTGAYLIQSNKATLKFIKK